MSFDTFTEMSHPEHRADEAEMAAAAEANATAEVVAIARQIRAWQESRKPRLSDEAVLRNYPGLGSTKTYRKLRDGDTSRLVIDTQLAKYRGVWAAIETEIQAAAIEDIYEDLTPAFECLLAVGGAIPQKGKNRLVLIEGPTGSGKSTALSIIEQRYAGLTARTEAHVGWASLNCAIGDMITSLTKDTYTEIGKLSMAEKLALVIATLRKGRRVLLIDEAHHCTAEVLNAIKSILNATDSIIVLAGIDTLWRKLAARSWEEARQLMHNRLYERVRLAPPTVADVEQFLTARVPALAAIEWKPAAQRIATMSKDLGHFAFLRRIAEHLAGEDAPDSGLVMETANRLKTSLETR